ERRVVRDYSTEIQPPARCAMPSQCPKAPPDARIQRPSGGTHPRTVDDSYVRVRRYPVGLDRRHRRTVLSSSHPVARRRGKAQAYRRVLSRAMAPVGASALRRRSMYWKHLGAWGILMMLAGAHAQSVSSLPVLLESVSTFNTCI